MSLQVLYGVNQRLRVEDVDSPLCEVRPVKTVLLVVLTGDRGLCGGYNNFIIKKVRLHSFATATAVMGQHTSLPCPAHAAASKAKQDVLSANDVLACKQTASVHGAGTWLGAPGPAWRCCWQAPHVQAVPAVQLGFFSRCSIKEAACQQNRNGRAARMVMWDCAAAAGVCAGHADQPLAIRNQQMQDTRCSRLQHGP